MVEAVYKEKKNEFLNLMQRKQVIKNEYRLNMFVITPKVKTISEIFKNKNLEKKNYPPLGSLFTILLVQDSRQELHSDKTHQKKIIP